MTIAISSAPHIKTPCTSRRIMLDVLIALLPATVAGIVLFGLPALVIVVLSLASAFLTELIFYLIADGHTPLRKRLSTFFTQFDFTSLITGLLLALCLPANLEGWYLPILGNAFAIAVVKMLFGGTGKNVVNPAVAGRIFLFISFLSLTTAYPAPKFGAILPTLGNLQTGATSLSSSMQGGGTLSHLDLLLGTGVTGCIGETCKLALLVGGAYLCARGVIKWYLPLLLTLSAGLGAVLFGGLDFSRFLPAILSGGLILGAIFMATDYTTTPKSKLGNLVYFIALGFLTAILRTATKLETTSFAVLLMNFTVFLIDRAIPVRPFGYRRTKEGK